MMLKKTKEELFRLMLQHFQMDKNAVVARLKSCESKQKVKMPFDVAEWDNYIVCLTGKAPCRFCGAPVRKDWDMVGFYNGDGLICVENRTHYLLIFAERIVSLAAWQICEHDEFKYACHICADNILKERSK
jgi:hypothetical protein